MSHLRIAAAQIECVAGDIAANTQTHLRFVAQAEAAGADLVVFPELSLTDYLSSPDLGSLGRSVRDEEIAAIVGASDRLAVSFGFIERDEDGRHYNTQALARSGRIQHVHRKLNLPTYGNLQEGLFYQKGERLDLAALDGGWEAATLICADSWSPALPWLAALRGANLLLQPIASARGAVGDGFDNPGGWDINLRHTAMTYALPTVMVNHCGTRANLDFWGGSRILDENGVVPAMAGDGPELVVASIDLDRVNRARTRLPTVRDSDPDFVREQLAGIIHPAA